MRDAFGRVQRVLVLGGGSEIAHATLAALAADGPLTALLAAREPERIETEALEQLGVSVERIRFDARDRDGHAAVFEEAFSGGDVDVVLVAFGVLGDQERDERDAAAAAEVAEVNFVGGISALTHAVERLREQGHGTAVVLSSIAGQRARRSNFVYGAAKAGLDAFAQGCQLALAGSGVRVMIVRPGFVHTKMTAGLKPAPFAVSPQEVAAGIAGGLKAGSAVVWAPGKLRWVAAILRALPAAPLRRL